MGTKWADLSEEAKERKRVRTRAASKKRKAARAIAAGRVPGVVGGPRKLSDADRVANRNAAAKRFRDKDPERSRAYDAEWKRKKRRKKAVSEGRKVGKPGHHYRAPVLTAEEKLERRRKRGALANRRRRARIAGASGSHDQADIEWLWENQKGNCVFCLKPLVPGKFHVDHHQPLLLGGTNDRKNLRLLHKKCNLQKSWRDPIDHALENGLLFW